MELEGNDAMEVDSDESHEAPNMNLLSAVKGRNVFPQVESAASHSDFLFWSDALAYIAIKPDRGEVF